MTITVRDHKLLWGKSGNRCAICQNVLVEGETDTVDESIVGEEAHIVARSENGPRGISELTLNERDKYDNLILLCRNHHKVVDDQPTEYTVEKLKQIKEAHESWVSNNLELGRDTLDKPQLKKADKNFKQDLKSYKADLLDEIINLELDEKCFDTIESPTFNYYLTQFINSDSWKSNLKKSLHDVRQNTLKLTSDEIKQKISRLTEVDTDKKYKTIVSNINSIIHRDHLIEKLKKYCSELNESKDEHRGNERQYVEDILDDLNELHDSIKHPIFGTCFMVAGSSGSGKTNLISDFFFKHAVSLIKLNPHDKDHTLKNCIIKELERITGTSINSFNDGKLLVSSVKDTIIIWIDNIERFIYTRKNFLPELIELVEELTIIENLRWIFCVNFNYLDIVIDYHDFFSTYASESVIKEDILISQSDRNLDKVHSFKVTEDVPHIFSGWLYLDNINFKDSIVSEILLGHYSSFPETSSNDAVLLRNKIEELQQKNISPYLAWLIIATWHDRLEMFDFTFLRLVNKIWDSLEPKIDKSEVQISSIKACINVISELVINSTTIDFNLVFLENEISEQSINRSVLEEKHVSRKAINQLLNINLLVKKFGRYHASEDASLHHLYYWQNSIAQALITDGYEVEQVIDYIDPKQRFWTLMEGFIGFYILNLELQESSSNLKLFLKKALTLNELQKAPIWFAGLKLNEQNRKMLSSYLNIPKFKFFTSKHDLYALMLFIFKVKNPQFSSSQRLEKLRLYYDEISEHRLQHWFIWLLMEMLDEVSNYKKFKDILVCLHGCERFGYTRAIAKKVVTNGMKLCKDNPTAFNRVIYNYFMNGVKNARHKKVKGNWQRHYLREWVLYYFTNYLIDENKIDLQLFAYFENNNWYLGTKNKLDHILKTDFERAANIALGNLYHRIGKSLRREYINQLNDLVNSKNEKKVSNCFHVIRHTKVTHGEIAVEVDLVFKDLLFQIYSDKRLKAIKRHFKDFFVLNKIIDDRGNLIYR